MKRTIGFCEFCDAFRDADRKENFTYEGKRVLFDFLESYEEETGADIELDVIAICCEYSEDTPGDIAADYRIDLSEVDSEDSEAITDTVMDYLNDKTIVCGRTNIGTIVYMVF